MSGARANKESLLTAGQRNDLADLLFPNITKTPEDYESVYPPRDLPPGALVTRFGPSPTGFVHLGNLYSSLTDTFLARQSGGVCILRIEDTDNKREIPGAVEQLVSSLAYFGVAFDEGAAKDGDKGAYGPYRQRQRVELYQTIAKSLIRKGRAYPCFCSEEELGAIRERQTAEKLTPGYYGPWAAHRDLSFDEIQTRLASGEKFTVRFRSMGDPSKRFTIVDGIRGPLTMPENDQDFVLLKADGIPTYHFAHAVDDHFMRITHIIRGEEWIATLPYHHELHDALGYEPPVFCHTTVLMKIDNGVKRKLSKRKDPELGLDYYQKLGFLPDAVRIYLLTVLNSNFEEWMMSNPGAGYENFPFTTGKMSGSGALFDLDKLRSISKDVLAGMTGREIYDFMLGWSEKNDPEFYGLIRDDGGYLLSALNIGRGGNNPRKDLINGTQIAEFVSFYYDSMFKMEDPYPERIDSDLTARLLEAYLEIFDPDDDNATWFAKVRKMGEGFGFAARPKDYNDDPDRYKGHVGDVSSALRVALTGRRNSPDLWEVQRVLGADRVRARVESAIESLRRGSAG